jgi:hypothetical protein
MGMWFAAHQGQPEFIINTKVYENEGLHNSANRDSRNVDRDYVCSSSMEGTSISSYKNKELPPAAGHLCHNFWCMTTAWQPDGNK